MLDTNEDLAIMFSRQQPARVLIPVNYNHLGAHNELIPVEFPAEKYPMPSFRKTKTKIMQRHTIIPDFNKPKQTPLFPPYYNAGTYDSNDPTAIYTGEQNVLTGKSIRTTIIPVY